MFTGTGDSRRKIPENEHGIKHFIPLDVAAPDGGVETAPKVHPVTTLLR